MIPAGCRQWSDFDRAVATYQRDIYDAAMDFVTHRNCAVDAGAHIGIFTKRMEVDFGSVLAFEPVPENFTCLDHNVQKAVIVRAALGAARGTVKLRKPSDINSGSWERDTDGPVTAAVFPLDMFSYWPVDFIKMDIQGMEPDALMGAYSVLMRWRPVVLIEWMANTKDNIRILLESHGYSMRREIGDNQVWTP